MPNEREGGGPSEGLFAARGSITGTREPPVVKPPLDMERDYPDSVIEWPDAEDESSEASKVDHPPASEDNERNGLIGRLREILRRRL